MDQALNLQPVELDELRHLDHMSPDTLSPYRIFSTEEWGKFRANTPLTLSLDEVERLQGMNDHVSMREVIQVYLPLSRLLALYVEANQTLATVSSTFLGTPKVKVPYIIGVAGSVAGGKSTTARLLKALLARWPNTPKVALVTTDGFLKPNARLQEEGLMDRKGFPESYDRAAILRFLSDVKAGKERVSAPIYSHFYYDVMPGQSVIVERPDILIVEGLNVLQIGSLPKDGRAIPFVSDFFDFSVYIDADEEILKTWYIERFMRLRETAFRDPQSYFHKYASTTDEEALDIATTIWERINLENLKTNILPTRARADLILTKGASHAVERVMLRKI